MELCKGGAVYVDYHKREFCLACGKPLDSHSRTNSGMDKEKPSNARYSEVKPEDKENVQDG